MSRRRNTRNEEYKYSPLPSTYDTPDGIDPIQFERPERKFPLKAVIFILVFMITGIICITLGALISFGIFEEKYMDRAWPLFILGMIMFIPGGYYGWIVISVLLGKSGYSVDDIPVL